MMSDRVWRCEFCNDHGSHRGTARGQSLLFKSPLEFVQHLRERHVTREGGSFVCRFGPNGICHSLPIEGVSDRDYEEHILKHHVQPSSTTRRGSSVSLSSAGAVSSVPIPASARTYHEIREQQQQQLQHQQQRAISSGGGGSGINISNAAEAQNGGLSVAGHGARWTVYHAVVNLPAALNDPRNRQTDIFSRTWGDSFERADVTPSPYLPNITRKHFDQYVRKVHSRRQKQQPSTSSSLTAESEATPQNTIYGEQRLYKLVLFVYEYFTDVSSVKQG